MRVSEPKIVVAVEPLGPCARPEFEFWEMWENFSNGRSLCLSFFQLIGHP